MGGWRRRKERKRVRGEQEPFMKNEGWPCAKGVSRGFISRRSRWGAITRRVGCRCWSQLSAEGINSERPKWGEVEKEGWRLLGGRMAMI
ncbi:hypothetical protein BDQ94DRAFT_140440 [Aspergillus welwitschiae]|uniref:Uncharacterized protein n=1 Tax=Aspergillus welwitschiae TaxID=1341132 RepID=A0A3F3Q7R0_9EURO|nr:hypothetical protein BDQ94DRAFT_140440 [Aspergillus welwitschiae]RDH35230.1 hypothetical protein BDQ94DRAFT_140440 [Aspergillus welwitschiae]